MAHPFFLTVQQAWAIAFMAILAETSIGAAWGEEKTLPIDKLLKTFQPLCCVPACYTAEMHCTRDVIKITRPTSAKAARWYGTQKIKM